MTHMQALLIIDVRNDYFPGGRCALHRSEAALSAVLALERYFHAHGLPTFYMQHIAAADGEFFLPDTVGAALHPDLNPCAEEVLAKHVPNSFQATPLHARLTALGADELVVCGMMTHMCVDTTVRRAQDLGYRVHLIANACATKELTWAGEIIPAPVVQAVYLAALNGTFAAVETSRQFLRQNT